MDARVRQLVRERAGRRHEYCHFPENALPYFVFHADHIIARQHVDLQEDAPEGLAWACSSCNYHKGLNLSSIDPESKQQVRLFDPRSDAWDDHFRIELGTISGTSPIGRATVMLLNTNAPRLIRLRLELIEHGVSF